MVHCYLTRHACASPESCTPSRCAQAPYSLVMADVVTTSPRPDPPVPYSLWRHRNGNEYVVLMLTNLGSTRTDKYPPTVVYRGVTNGGLWSRRLDDWHRSMTFHRLLTMPEIAHHRADV